ncbi:Oidioi.mRNA.OKI2018_I69.chr1.g3637.t1.cds [Oikopleura dioica]|uniref:Oidioi.mRNA.OKI2018_I69.chr1.g3637.t1.cds n=1 Tax=Oikopleura dioica TaxID=34765 RepID=A0ABN7T0B1_OIKDI|nr:Oidioi.mRNA.OKI2018_I69.chr1.g3637.t1.cds [Oikopleura dioica]
MGKKDEDEIPLLEASEISERRSRVRKTPKLETVETIRYKVQADETLESIALRFAVSKEELKRLNNLFTDSDLITKKEILIPDRRLTAVPTDLLVNIEDQIQDSETSSSIGDATAATDAIFDRIDKSNQEAVHKVSSIGIRHPLTEAEIRQQSENRLNEFLGNLPPVAVLPKFGRYEQNSESTEWCYLGLCGVVVVICVPAFLYYYLIILQKHITIDP